VIKRVNRKWQPIIVRKNNDPASLIQDCVFVGEVIFMMAETDRRVTESSKAQCAEHLTPPHHTVTSLLPPSSVSISFRCFV